ncbi:MAG TPA: DUF72 domain-containing protein [Acidimicrobiales bacterium]|nr:DUF72 domain-containing protein [Acidimicrobiales bacterium]
MSKVLVGASSWSARSLVHDSRWYPRRSMKAAQRIAYYTDRFPIVELDATYRFPPTPDVARQWVERTPAGFVIDIQAWTLLTGNATLPDSLWEDLRVEVRPELRHRRRLYLGHLSHDGRVEAWRRFRHAIQPLFDGGRLGAVILRYPHWLPPGGTGRALMSEARRHLSDIRLAVELRNHHWLDEDQRESTLAFLEDEDLAFVCVDSLHGPPVVATTNELAVVRLDGRNPGDREEPDASLAERFAYRYSADELGAWAVLAGQLADAAEEVHVLFANAFGDCAVANAAELAELVAATKSCPR